MAPRAPLQHHQHHQDEDTIRTHILALTCLRLLLAAGGVFVFSPSLLGGGFGVLPAMATLAAPVLYTVLFALLLFCRPRGLLGAATLLLLGVVEGAAIGAALALLGWGWAIRTAFVALVAGAAVFAGLAAAAFHTPRFREGALGAGLLCGLIGSSVGFLIEANATEMLCARFGVLGGTVFAVRDMSGVVARVGTNEAGLGAGVLGMAVILDSVTREASYV